MKKNILIILGHPKADSYCAALADAYSDGAKAGGNEVRKLHISELTFDPILWNGYSKTQELEPDLAQAQELISWSHHIVFVYPIWWGTMPSLLKGFLERILLPGFAFKYRDDSVWWDKLLQGKTAHLITTLDTPSWYYRFIYSRPGYNQMKKVILGFCGIKVNKVSQFSPIKGSSLEKRVKWLSKVKQDGMNV